MAGGAIGGFVLLGGLSVIASYTLKKLGAEKEDKLKNYYENFIPNSDAIAVKKAFGY